LLANDLRIAASTSHIPHPYGIGDAEQFIASANERAGEACFIVQLENKPIGICSVTPRGDDFELGYWFGVSYWGRGFATEAARAVIDHAFGDIGHEALLSGTRVTNPASRRVLEKCGFQWTDVRLYRIRAINSAAPIDRFRLDRGLWASLKSWGRAGRAV
jgi:RimJ/RimL family protein N-acetyltransferase